MKKRKLLLKLLVSDLLFFVRNIFVCDIDTDQLEFISIGHLHSYTCLRLIERSSMFSRRDLKATKKELKRLTRGVTVKPGSIITGI